MTSSSAGFTSTDLIAAASQAKEACLAMAFRLLLKKPTPERRVREE
jgi:hypothetical protein